MNRLLINERPFFVLPTLAERIGLNESIFVQQLHYWLGESQYTYDGHKWVYNTYEDWHAQFPFWSLSTIKRMINRLEQANIIITGNYNRFKLDKTKWYTINYEELYRISEEEYEDRSQQTTENEIELDEPEIQEKNILNNPSATNEQMDDSIVSFERKMNSSSAQHELPEDTDWDSLETKLNKAIPETTSEITPEKKEIDDDDDNAHARELNPFQFFEQNGFGTVGSFIAEQIDAWCKDLSEEMVLEAMKLAVVFGSKKWKYVESILRSWAERGFKNLEDVRADQLNFKKSKIKMANKKNAPDKPKKPKYFVLDITAGERD